MGVAAALRGDSCCAAWVERHWDGGGELTEGVEWRGEEVAQVVHSLGNRGVVLGMYLLQVVV